jgi:hypothetical protein
MDSETPAETEFAAFNTNLVSIDDTAGRTFKHTVRRGENISIIAHHYHISQARLLELNSGVAKLRVGQRITVAEGSGRTRRNHLAKSHANRNAKLVHSNKEYTGNNNLNLASNR